ncbi:MAG: hypothetical protein FJ403_10775 [Verrucomicrobia bacterium]|nr:hypothetical protein [Verrucomicrobiota bacterium]
MEVFPNPGSFALCTRRFPHCDLASWGDSLSIFAGWRKLTWSHYRTLARLPDKKQRLELEARAEREEWNAEKLEEHVRFLVEGSPKGDGVQPARPVILLEPKRGKLGIYRIVPDGDGCAVDLGFKSYQIVKDSNRSRAIRDTPTNTTFKAGELVALSPAGELSLAPEATQADLYSYDAEILRVVDGDTLWVKIWLKPDQWLKEKLRLRGLDCPELDTPEGKAAKRFVEGLVTKAVSVTVTTTKPDKWDRYLSDIFVARENGEEVFLNNLLLEKGHARRTDKVAAADWDEQQAIGLEAFCTVSSELPVVILRA